MELNLLDLKTLDYDDADAIKTAATEMKNALDGLLDKKSEYDDFLKSTNKKGYSSENYKLPSSSTIRNHRSFLSCIEDGMSLELIQKRVKFKLSSIKKGFELTEETISKLRFRFGEHPEEYIKNNLNDKKWYVYFLYYPRNENSEATLGRAVISVEHNRLIQNVHLTNTEKSHANYDGNYEPYIPEHGIIVFSFNSASPSRKLHIKVYCDNKDQQIMLGHFLTYEESHIQSGTVMLVAPENPEEEMEPDIFSFLMPNKFDNVDDTILKFFTLKSENHFRTFRGVDSLETLKTELNKKSFVDDKNSWFLEKHPAEIFIATPVTGAGFSDDKPEKKLLSDVVEFINEKIPEGIKITSRIQGAGKDEKGNYHPVKTLDFLRTQRIFILLLDNVRKLGFSMIQLGFALAHSKKVVLVCKQENISERIYNGFDKNVLELVFYKGSITQDKQIICDRLVEIIKDNLNAS